MRSLSGTPPLVSIVVANWNGEAWLGRCLSSLQISARRAAHPFELIVVDDASTDRSRAMIREQFPGVILLTNDRNIGFARSINRGAFVARGRVLVLANNDIVAQEGFIPSLVRWFVDPPKPARRLFAVSAKTVGWYDGLPNQLCMGALWRGGRLTPAYNDPKEATPCLFAQAGAAAYDLNAWRRLGGLATFYEPGYWEDYDVSWRASKAGYTQIYDPGAFALHVGGGSMTKRYGAQGVAAMKSRNHVLFEAANLTSPRLLAEWAVRVPVRMAREWGHPASAGDFSTGFSAAIPRIHHALRARVRLASGISDLSLLRPYRHFTASF